MNQGPDMVAWGALREQQYSPREAARAADIVVQALRKKGLLKEPQACACPEPERFDMEDAERAICGAPKPLSKEEWSALDQIIAEFDAGETESPA
jgi:hypothetical protein